MTIRSFCFAMASVVAAQFAILTVVQDAAAQTFPSRPVRLMVGAPAGGGTDIVARMLGEKLTDALKQPFVVDNRPGASNTIAADVTAKSPPDGHTLLVATNTGQAIAPHLLKLNFDVLKDLPPVALVMVVPNVLIVGPSVTAGEAFKKIADVSMTHIPYKVAAKLMPTCSPARRS